MECPCDGVYQTCKEDGSGYTACACPVIALEGGEAAQEGGEATQEGGEAAQEGGEAATEEGGEAATEEGGEAATEEGGEAATEEGGEFTAGSACEALGGTCQDVAFEPCDSGYVSGLCPGASNIQCCGGDTSAEEGGEWAEEGGEWEEEGGEDIEDVWTCADGETIPYDYVCDGYDDCESGEDEVDCP